MSIYLINNTKATSKVGSLVSIDPSKTDSFIYTTVNSSRAVGICTESVPYRAKCKIATIGDKAKVLVQGNATINAVIRGSKSGDSVSLGTCKIAKLGDAPYLRVGTALSNGSGLIDCNIDLIYVSGVTDSVGLGAIPDGTYTVGLGISTDGVIVVKDGIIISLTEAT
jgi:hypothetical protein